MQKRFGLGSSIATADITGHWTDHFDDLGSVGQRRDVETEASAVAEPGQNIGVNPVLQQQVLD